MKLEDVKLGMKVNIPKTKTNSKCLISYEEFVQEFNEKGQGVDYLIVREKEYMGKEKHVLLGFEDERKHLNAHIFSIDDIEPYEETKYLKLWEIARDMIFQIINGGSLKGKGFYLNEKYNWEIVEDSFGDKVLVPTKK